MSNLKNTLNTNLNIENTSNKLIKTFMNFDLTGFKVDYFNSLQYTLLSIIPILLSLKLIKHIIPEVDETKGSMELFLESIGQISLTIFLLLLTGNLVRLIPTYSGVEYNNNIDTLSFTLPFLFLMLTMQTKIGEKINILSQRFLKHWKGEDHKQNNNHTNIERMNTQNNMLPPPIATQDKLPNYKNSNELNHSINNPMHNPTNNSINNNNNLDYIKEKPDFNAMYQQNNMNNMNNNSQSQNNSNLLNNEPIAANLGVNSAYSNW